MANLSRPSRSELQVHVGIPQRSMVNLEVSWTRSRLVIWAQLGDDEVLSLLDHQQMQYNPYLTPDHIMQELERTIILTVVTLMSADRSLKYESSIVGCPTSNRNSSLPFQQSDVPDL